MADNTLDFDQYKSVIDYISSNTGTISASLKSLIENTLATRADSILNIVSSGAAIKSVNIGAISIDLENNVWECEVPISLDLNGFDSLVVKNEGPMPMNMLSPAVLTDEIIEKISESFVSKTTAISSLLHAYTSAVTSFSEKQVPNLQFFIDNYYSTKDIEIDKHIVLTSRDVNGENNAITYALGNILSGAKKSDKKINASTGFLSTNILFVDSDRAELKFTPAEVELSGGTIIKNARSNKSVILKGMIANYLMSRNLENAVSFSMEEAQDDNSSYVGTSSFALALMSEEGQILQKEVTVDQNTINGTSIDFAADSYYSVGAGDEVACVSDIKKFNILESALKGDKGESSVLGEDVSAILSTLSDPSGTARNRAVSIKTLYSMVSAMLGEKFSDIFINASDRLSLSSQINLILQEGDFVFGSRPTVTTAIEAESEVATFRYIPISIGEKDQGDNELSSSSWVDYA